MPEVNNDGTVKEEAPSTAEGSETQVSEEKTEQAQDQNTDGTTDQEEVRED